MSIPLASVSINCKEEKWWALLRIQEGNGQHQHKHNSLTHLQSVDRTGSSGEEGSQEPFTVAGRGHVFS